MSHLKSLTFAPAPQKEHSNPAVLLRQKLIARLEEQRRLAKDPNYAPKQRRWKKNPDGSRVQIELSKAIKPWWKSDTNGKLVLMLRSGLKPIEIEKGKPAVFVGAPERLDEVLGVLIEATRAGELDRALEGVKGDLGTPSPASVQQPPAKPISDIKKRVFG
jgi:hypothetical protein